MTQAVAETSPGAIMRSLATGGPRSDSVRCSLKGVNKSYDGRTRVVADLDLDIYRGEFLTLLGPSGSGKTTTLMMLAGFEDPSSGSIDLDNRSLLGIPACQRNIGMVFQNYALFPHMTVAENLGFPLRMRGVPRAERDRKVRDMLQIVRLPEVENRWPAQLSGGQQQRVALARALIFEPQLVLMDEPLGALDKQLREHMQLEIRHLHEKLGITIVYVTHDQSEALTMSDRVAVFSEGRIQQVAPPRDIYEWPENAFVANFIGDNNQLRGRVVGVGSRHYTVDCGGIQVAAVSRRTYREGDDVLVLFRPENAVVGHPIPPLPNEFFLTMLEHIYLGDHVRIRSELANGVELTIRISNKAHLTESKPGESFSAYWSGKECHVLPLPDSDR
jgi:putative spermidine/putrescine transport system ATP-binding protein